MLIQQGYTPEESTVLEMTDDATGNVLVDIEVEQSVIANLVKGDSDPMFVTIEVLNERKSNNGRQWTKEAIVRVAEQINSKHPDGFWGHMTQEERATKFPDPQTIWLGAVVKEVNGKAVLYAKGYVLPEATKARSYIKKAQAVGKKVAVSVYGKTRAMTKAGLTDMRNFVLESIDWARTGAEGVPALGNFVVTSEMTDDSAVDLIEGEKMTKEEVLQSASESELREHSSVVSEMIDTAVSAKEAELEAVVSEMEELQTILGATEDTSVTQLVQEMVAEKRERDLESELQAKVENPKARSVLRTLVVAEMTDDMSISEAVDRVLESETGRSVIKDMTAVAPKVAPQTQREAVVVARKHTVKR